MRWMIKRLLVTWQHPDDALLADGAILVDLDGRRFCDEGVTPEREIAVAGQRDKQAYMLLDEALVERYSTWPHFVSTAPEIAYAYVDDYLRLRPDIAIAGATLDVVARARGLDPRELATTVAGYNASFGEAGPAGVARTGGRPLTGARWVLLGPLKSYFTNTEGGVAIDRDLRVLDTSGRPIPGLYAAGQTGLGGMVLWAHGLHIAWALTSGRLVGAALGQRTTGRVGRADHPAPAQVASDARQPPAAFRRRRRCAPQPPERARIEATSSGTIAWTSPTTNRSLNGRIGASGSMLMATTALAVRMPTRCWTSPEMPRAT